MAAMLSLGWSAGAATAVQQKPPAKTAAAKKKSSPAKKGASTATAKKGTAGAGSARKPGAATKTASAGGKKTKVKPVTWRNRQAAPTPDRYREIQGALAAKGFLNPEDATGGWNQTSSDALKKFQSEQNLESSGKINSLSLIALGLGPHHDAAPVPKNPPQPPGQ
jgi:hypothetical protein